MHIVFEEYQYKASEVKNVLSGISTLQDVEQKVSVNYVGYYYNAQIKDCVFILPKVLLNDSSEVIIDNKKQVKPEDIITPEGQERNLSKEYRKFIYEFSVWVYRALSVYHNHNKNSKALYYKQLPQEGHGKKHKANTLLDIILSLIRFNKENQNFFLYTIKNIHSGTNKINWSKTIANSTAIIQKEEPAYLSLINKKKLINFDEELFIIFFSILNHINQQYGFKASLNCNYPLLTKGIFKQYMDGLGKKRLRAIRYKYYSDKAIQLWDLCYAFFDFGHQLSINTDQREYLLAKNFNIIFEAIIDDLIGDPREEIPNGLKDQLDGKRVDHMYHDLALNEPGEKNEVYYIGDSKYYKIGHEPGSNSVYKQFTYARNVIQWNINLFLNDDDSIDKDELESRQNDRLKYSSIQLRKDNSSSTVINTEGYNIIPNFFISAFVDPERKYNAHVNADVNTSDGKIHDGNIKPHLKAGEHSTYISYQFPNRLFDRDTLILSHYDVNFLYVIYLYARNKQSEKAWWKERVRRIFREEIRDVLDKRYHFYAMKPHYGVDANKYLKENFQQTLGKIYTPYVDDTIFALALDRQDPEGTNNKLLDELRNHFYIVENTIGNNPESRLNDVAKIGDEQYMAAEEDRFNEKIILVGTVRNSDPNHNDFVLHRAKKHSLEKVPSGNILSVKYFIPMVNGAIEGYYEVTRISLGYSNGQPRLNLDLGKYKRLGDSAHKIPSFYQHTDFLSLEQIRKIYEGEIML